MKKEDFKHGDSVTCQIYDKIITDAKISFNSQGELFICQDKCNGSKPKDLFGYDYAWQVTENSRDDLTLEEQMRRNSVKDLKLVIPKVKSIVVKSDDILTAEFDEETMALLNSGADRI